MTTITFKALISRINRKLKPVFQRLRKNRSSRDWNYLGDFFIEDFRRNTVIDSHVDPKKIGREIGVLMPSERVRTDEIEEFITAFEVATPAARSRALDLILANRSDDEADDKARIDPDELAAKAGITPEQTARFKRAIAEVVAYRTAQND